MKPVVATNRGPLGGVRRRRGARALTVGLGGLLSILAIGVGADPPGELRIGIPRLPQTLDPAVAAGGPELMVFRHLFEGLARVGDHGNLEPALATQWRVSRDGLTWTFRLRPDVRFHDGTPLTPEIVVASLARHLTPQEPIGEPVAGTGLGPKWARVFPGTSGLVREVRAGGPGAVQINLRRPFSPLLGLLAHPALAIVLTENGGDVPFLGTGPYRVAARGPGRLTLEAATGPAVDGSRVARLLFYEMSDDAAGVAELGPSGLLDVYFPEAPPAWAGLGLQVLSAPTWQTGLLALRSTEGLLGRKVMRQAVALGLDPTLVRPALGRWAAPHDSYLPPGAWGARAIALPASDPRQARRLLRESGVPALRATLLALEAPSGPDTVALGEAVRLSLAVAGVAVDVRAEPSEAYFGALRQGEADLALFETTFEINDPHFALQPLVASGAGSRGSATNVAFYRSSLVDGMLRRASQLAFRPERLRLYRRLQGHLAEELPYVPLYVRLQWALARPTVRNLRLEPGGRHRLDRVWIEAPVPATAPSRPGPETPAVPTRSLSPHPSGPPAPVGSAE